MIVRLYIMTRVLMIMRCVGGGVVLVVMSAALAMVDMLMVMLE